MKKTALQAILVLGILSLCVSAGLMGPPIGVNEAIDNFVQVANNIKEKGVDGDLMVGLPNCDDVEKVTEAHLDKLVQLAEHNETLHEYKNTAERVQNALQQLGDHVYTEGLIFTEGFEEVADEVYAPENENLVEHDHTLLGAEFSNVLNAVKHTLFNGVNEVLDTEVESAINGMSFMLTELGSLTKTFYGARDRLDNALDLLFEHKERCQMKENVTINAKQNEPETTLNHQEQKMMSTSPRVLKIVKREVKVTKKIKGNPEAFDPNESSMKTQTPSDWASEEHEKYSKSTDLHTERIEPVRVKIIGTPESQVQTEETESVNSNFAPIMNVKNEDPVEKLENNVVQNPNEYLRGRQERKPQLEKEHLFQWNQDANSDTPKENKEANSILSPAVFIEQRRWK